MKDSSIRHRILIVDDAPENVWSLIKNLEKDYDVLYATSGEKALEIVLEEEKPDVILLDIIMPEMDGYEVIKKLKDNESTSDIPIIFLTAKTEEEDETKGFNLGAWDYITKPFSMPVVKARLHSVLNLKKEMDRRLFLKQQMESLNIQLENQVQQKIKELKEAREALQNNEKKYHILFKKRHIAKDSGKTILIVDDNPENIHVLSKNLEDEYEILYATSGEKALEIAFSEERLDLILLDIMMPGMDGYEVCSRLKANADTWDIPIIFITAMSLAEDETKGLELGAFDYISKPFSMAVVRARIATALRLKEEMDNRLILTRQLQDLNKDLEKRVTEKVVELKQAHDDLKISENKYRSIFENAVEGIFQITPEGRILSANPSMSCIFGYDSPGNMIESVADVGIQLYADTDERGKIMEILIKEGMVKGYEARMQKKDGTPIWCAIYARLVRNEQDEILCTEGFCMDITRQRMAEDALRESELRLRQAQKMEAIGTLASGIAHDFNNILSPIMGYTELSMDCVASESSEHSYMKEVLKATQRARGLVNQILSFSRQAERIRKPLCIKLVVKEVVKLIKSAFPSTIEIQENINSKSMILADPVEIHQVVMNLCTNSLHSMRDKGGVLQVSLSDIEIKSDNTPQTLNILPGHYIMLKVADTGYGMSQEILERIFEPYFTTKPKGEGTGLGLATVHGIVEDINGNISVKSEVGRGTTFTLYFPGIEHDVDKDGKKASSGLIPGGNEHILLVDDEKQICELMCKMLESLGYHVTPHISGIEALADLKNRPHEFDMLLTDMTMPKMTGLQLIMQIKMIRLDIPVIIFTGFSESIDRKKAHALGVHEFVMKPVVRSDIAGAIRRALAAPEKE